MSPRQRRKFYASHCCGKLRHENYLTALHHAAYLRFLHPSDFFSIYPCYFCAGLHLGHRHKTLPEQDLVLVSSMEALNARAPPSLLPPSFPMSSAPVSDHSTNP